MKNILALVLMVFGIVGCATNSVSDEEKIRQLSESFDNVIGLTEAELIRKGWGEVPQNQQFASGIKFITYYLNSRCSVMLEIKNDKVITYTLRQISGC